MEISVLLVGFMIGLRHALEADHVAAVASIVTQKQGKSAALRHGAVWGLGHTLTLFAFGTAALLADTLIPDHTAAILECAVGFMLLYLGLDVLWRMAHKGIHIHVHQHHGKRHIHAHQHSLEIDRTNVSAHQHKHKISVSNTNLNGRCNAWHGRFSSLGGINPKCGAKFLARHGLYAVVWHWVCCRYGSFISGH